MYQALGAQLARTQVLEHMRQPGGKLTTLNVHGIGVPPRTRDRSEDGSWITVGQFELLLDSIADRPEVRLTFDDGNASDLEIALPRLLQRGLTAQFFILAGRLGEPNRLDEAGVRTLVETGMSVGSHGWAHRDWRRLSDKDAREEIDCSLGTLSTLTGRPVRRVAVPFGCYDRTVLRRLRRAGVERVYNSDGGTSRPGSWLQRRTSLRSDVDREWLNTVLDDRFGAPVRARRVAVGWVKRSRGSWP